MFWRNPTAKVGSLRVLVGIAALQNRSDQDPPLPHNRALSWLSIYSVAISIRSHKAGCLPKGMNAIVFRDFKRAKELFSKCEQKRTDDASKGNLLSTQVHPFEANTRV
jgi:hypothetical protein